VDHNQGSWLRDNNYSAWIENSLLQTSNDLLSQLVNPITGNQIERFPERPQNIAEMTVTELNSVLGQLGVRSHGDKLEKQRRLRVYVGLRAKSA
jgi:hypothetical protein